MAKSTPGLPASLTRLLREANVRDCEVAEIHLKLKQRTTSQIVSYLQLAWLNLQQHSIADQEFVQQLQSHRERSNFMHTLDDRVRSLRG